MAVGSASRARSGRGARSNCPFRWRRQRSHRPPAKGPGCATPNRPHRRSRPRQVRSPRSHGAVRRSDPMVGSGIVAVVPPVVFRWTFPPAVVLPIGLTAVAYLRGVVAARRRTPSRSWTPEAVCFLGGLALVLVALCSPLDALADESLAVHMVQHLVLTLVAPPLLLLGRPLTLAHAATSARTSGMLVRLARTRVARCVAAPVFGFASFSLVLWWSHMSSFY